MRNSFEQIYMKLREAGSASDFPYVLGDSLHKELLQAAAAIASTWEKWCKIQPNIQDFKENKRIKISETDDLEEVPAGHDAKESSFDEAQASYIVKKFERIFGVPWELLINDDIGAIAQRPQAMGRAAALTLAKFAVALLVARAASSAVTTALSETTLAAARLEFKTRTDPHTGNRVTLVPKYLIVPPDLETTGLKILNSQQLIATTITSGSPVLSGSYNAVNASETKLELCVEPLLTDANDWYLAADPNITPGIEVGFFRGQRNPQVFVESSGIQGNDNPFTNGNFKNSSINYKVRHIFGGAIVDTNGLLKVAVT
jgi:hypothetical protein